MRVLLSDGSGLTARQTAAQLADAGHTVGVLSPDPVCLARFTRRVRHVWRVPPYGPDPLRWLDAMLSVYQSAGTDVLVPTQEQVAVLSACDDLLRAAGVRTAVPSFEALSQVQDKLSAFATLTAAGLPQPEGAILATPADVAAWDRFHGVDGLLRGELVRVLLGRAGLFLRVRKVDLDDVGAQLAGGAGGVVHRV